MPVGELTVEVRNGTGKGAARRLRATGKIPGICYGNGRQPLSISLSAKALADALDPERRRNTVIHMKVEGGETVTVMLKDYQVDAVKNTPEHADFVAIDMAKEVHVTVPVVLTGKSEGVKLGGIMHQVHRTLAVAALPSKIPARIEADVTELGMGDAFHVRDLKLVEGLRALLDGTDTIAVVVAPKTDKAAEAAAEAATAEAAAAAPAAGAKPGDKAAAPAAGAKPGDKAAAGAKPAAGAAKAPAAAAKPAAKK
jgi:large subunit ribosomal protein L25